MHLNHVVFAFYCMTGNIYLQFMMSSFITKMQFIYNYNAYRIIVIRNLLLCLSVCIMIFQYMHNKQYKNSA